MNYEFRKKPVVVQAFQMTEARRWNNIDWPEWLNKAWNYEPLEEGGLWIDPSDPTRARLFCGTLEGPHRIDWDDFIIQGIKGELYPCKPDIFEATYDYPGREAEEEEMTPEEKAKINERLAKFMGWRFERQVSSSVVQTMTRVCTPPDGSAEVFPPDYTTDLVEVMEVLDTFRRKQYTVEIIGEELYDGGSWIVRIRNPVGVMEGRANDTQRYSEEKGDWDEPNLAGAIARACYEAIGEGR